MFLRVIIVYMYIYFDLVNNVNKYMYVTGSIYTILLHIGCCGGGEEAAKLLF